MTMQAVLTEELAVVGGHDDQGVIEQPLRAKAIEQHLEPRVDICNLAVVLGDQGLVLAAAWRWEHAIVGRSSEVRRMGVEEIQEQEEGPPSHPAGPRQCASRDDFG